MKLFSNDDADEFLYLPSYADGPGVILDAAMVNMVNDRGKNIRKPQAEEDSEE